MIVPTSIGGREGLVASTSARRGEALRADVDAGPALAQGRRSAPRAQRVVAGFPSNYSVRARRVPVLASRSLSEISANHEPEPQPEPVCLVRSRVLSPKTGTRLGLGLGLRLEKIFLRQAPSRPTS